MSTNTRLASVKETVEYKFPQDYWMKCVAEVTAEDKETIWFSQAHIVNGHGDVVCDCKFHPRKTHVFRVGQLSPESRTYLCATSMACLRKKVAELRKNGL